MRTFLTLAVLLAAAAPAHASFPGANGDLVLSLQACELGSDLAAAAPEPKGSFEYITNRCGDHDADADFDNRIDAPEAFPDGTRIFARSYLGGTGLVSLPAGGGALTPLPVPDSLVSFSLAPDGKSYYAEGDDREDTSEGVDGLPLVQVFLDGRPTVTVIPAEAETCDHEATCSDLRAPRISPDGALLALQVTTRKYVKGDAGSLRPGVWLFSVRTGEPVRRVAGPGVDVDWAPNAKRLVYASPYKARRRGGADGGNLFVVGRDGQHRRSLVHREDLAETEPVWSPDGRSVAFVSLNFGAGALDYYIRNSLWAVSVKTRRLERLQGLPRLYNSEDEPGYKLPDLAWLPK